MKDIFRRIGDELRRRQPGTYERLHDEHPRFVTVEDLHRDLGQFEGQVVHTTGRVRIIRTELQNVSLYTLGVEGFIGLDLQLYEVPVDLAITKDEEPDSPSVRAKYFATDKNVSFPIGPIPQEGEMYERPVHVMGKVERDIFTQTHHVRLQAIRNIE